MKGAEILVEKFELNLFTLKCNLAPKSWFSLVKKSELES